MRKAKKWISCIVIMLLIVQWCNIRDLSVMTRYLAQAQEKGVKVNFQPSSSEIPDGYIPDYGEIYGSKNGYTYGWNTSHENDTVSRAVYSKNANDTFCQFQDGDIWEIELESGIYDVTVSVGDAVYGSTNTMKVEGIPYWDNITLGAGEFAVEAKQLEVSDGKLTVEQGFTSAYDTKINYIEIIPKELAEDTEPPTKPQNLTYQNVSHNEVTLAWDNSTDDNGVDGYIVYRDDANIATIMGAVYYEDTDVLPCTTYNYEVAAFDTSNNISDKSEALQITTATEPGNGIGLIGEYYNGIDFEDLKLSRTDEFIDFDWESGSPDQGMDSDSFSIRWEGKVEARFTQNYTFYTETHGGVRLWVDDQLLIDYWEAHNMTTQSGNISLIAGETYDIKMEYRETNGAAIARLLWSSKSQSKEIIPESQLYPPFVPEVPTNINIASTSSTITLSWDEVDGATGYDIEADGVIIDNGENTTFIHDDLMSSTLHQYRVRSKIPGVVSPWSSIYSQRTKIGVPDNVNAESVDTTVIVTWDEVAGATGYDIEVNGSVIDNGLSTTYTHSGLMPNTEHTYRVRAKNGEGISDWSELISKTVLAEIPSNIIVNITSGSITITWDEVTGATGYDIEVDGSIIDNGLNTTYVHSGLTSNTQHTYRIRARKIDGVSGWSQLLIKSTLPEPSNGTGLKGEYFHNENLTDLKTTRIDENINFDWKNNSPAPGIEEDEFSTRWTGQIEPRFSEYYTFYTETHGGVRLWIDGQLLVDDWEAHNMVKTSEIIHLESGRRYDIKMEYRETNGTAKAALLWSSISQPQEVVPQSQLYPIGMPQNINTTSTETTITLSWDEVTYANRYEIEVDGVLIDNGSSTSFIHDNLVPGTQHTYRIRAVNGIVVGEWSPTIVRTTLLGKPSEVTIEEVTETTITVAWESVYGAVNYDIEIDGIIVNNGNDTVFTHKNLNPGTLHSYRVRARSEYVTGAWTSIIEKWTLPDVPKNITTQAASEAITITWDEVIGAIGYDLEIYGEPVDNGASTEYIHTGLNSNMQYTYRVRAKNPSGHGKWTGVIAETTLPEAPTNINTAATDTSIEITWDAVAGAASYDIEIDKSAIEEVNNTNYLHSGMVPNTSHTYRIRSKNSDGMSNWSEYITEMTLPSTPTNLNGEVTDSWITVTWDEVAGATGYDIEVDGVVIDNGLDTTYNHTNLEANTEHTYRVRARNGEVTSFWSLEITKITLLGIPANLQATATSTEITVSWDTVVGASGYDIEVDGRVIDNGLSTTFIDSGLEPNTEHTYRVRARNVAGAGEWSEAITKTTLLGIPTNLTAASTSTSITISWDEVAEVTGYDVLVDGEIIDNGSDTTYVHNGLEPNTWHIYRVRARSGEYTGDWSEGITWATLVGIPTNITLEATSTRITVTWDDVIGATDYEIEVDGVVIDNSTSTTYVHSGLSPNTVYNYRVRAKNENGIGDWSSISDWSTLLPQITAPDIPENLRATATTTQITITWDEADGADDYDIEVDGVVIENIKATSYIHTGLEPNTWHLYRVRAKNEGGTSQWSEELQQNTNPEIAVNVGKDTTFNFVVVAPKKEGVNTRTIVVNYNPDELEVIDLCAVTPETNLETGDIEGTNITVTEFSPGEIKYTISNADKTVVNSIKFIDKINEYSKITYSIE